MTNEEKANEIARDMLPYNNAEYHACYNSAMKAMEWKDKERKELWRITRNHYQEWAEEQIAQEKQKLIDEACEWLAKNDSYAKPTHLQVDRLREHLKHKMKGE
jgi:hypothetical protein